jgi:mevalonate kinase
MKSDESTVGFGCGKVILLGEHAVVHGQPALVAGMKAGVRAHASPGHGALSAPAWGMELEIGDDSLPGQAVARLLERLQAPKEMDLWLECEVPARAGLGSSAAMSVAIARAVGARVGADEMTVMAAVAEAEAVFHRKPSGIDAAAASRGGIGAYDRQRGWQPLTCKTELSLCIGLSGKSHDTGALVAGVGQLCESTPVAHRLVETLGDLARAGTEALVAGELSTLARIFNLAHGLLGGLGVSCRELDDLVYIARAAGAEGAKLTGAGGGGAAIAIAGDHSDEVLRAWRGKGYYGFLTTIAHD